MHCGPPILKAIRQGGVFSTSCEKRLLEGCVGTALDRSDETRSQHGRGRTLQQRGTHPMPIADAT
jgi:hypothetical protein